MSRPLSRRYFIGALGAGAATSLLAARARAVPSAAGKLNIAGIGVGGMGAGNLAALASENIVALCDVDPNYAAPTIKRYPGARLYSDYRVMLEKQRDIDAVVIATPDHTHAVIAAAAMRAHKHVYLQKPLTHDVREARALARIARETGVATQMGIQGHSSDGVRQTCEWIRDGAIGDVREVDAWCDLSYYPWGHVWWSSRLNARPAETPTPPAGLDWDLWLGPAPLRPYHPTYHPQSWRAWWDFGCGMMGDRGAHTLDGVYWSLDLGAPSSVDATSCGLNPDTHPVSAIVTFRFPARGKLPPVTLRWFEGTRAPRPPEMDADLPLPGEGGAIFRGTKGVIVTNVYSGDPWLFPESRRKAYKRPARSIERVPDSHEMDWVRACKGGKPAGAHFGYSGPLTEMCLLGNVAKRLDGRIDWDAANMRVTNRPDAAPIISPAYRNGWSLGG